MRSVSVGPIRKLRRVAAAATAATATAVVARKEGRNEIALDFDLRDF